KGMVRRTQAFYEGVIPRIKRMYHETSSELVRKQISSYLVQKECATCKGTRLKEEMLHVRIGDKNIDDISQMTIDDAQHFFQHLQLSPKDQEIAKEVLKEIRERLGFLINVGLEY